MVKVVEWKDDEAGGWSGAGGLAFLLGKYGHLLNREEHGDVQIHTFTDIELDQAWTFYEALEPLTVHYDGGIVLHGAALGQGAEQLSSQRLPLGRDRVLWGVLQWQTSPGLEIDYARSLRLYNAWGAREAETALARLLLAEIESDCGCYH